MKPCVIHDGRDRPSRAGSGVVGRSKESLNAVVSRVVCMLSDRLRAFGRSKSERMVYSLWAPLHQTCGMIRMKDMRRGCFNPRWVFSETPVWVEGCLIGWRSRGL